jgi:hypothetical protein
VTFAALLLAADLVGTLAVSDRTELRLRAPGTAPGPAAASFDLETVPTARLMLASPRWQYALTYAPRLTLWDVNAGGVRPTALHDGAARIEWRSLAARLSLAETGSYGGVDLAAFALTPGADGAAQHVDLVPAPQIIQFASSTTTLASRLTLGRWLVATSVGYQLSGGADAEARAVLPFQIGPFGELSASYAASRRDHVITTLTASEELFSSGPESLLMELDEGWRHALTRTTDVTLTLGASESRARMSALAAHDFETHPVAEAVLEQRNPRPEGQVDLRLDVRLGPVVNRLVGIVDERVGGTLTASHTYRRLTTHALAGVSQSVPASGAYATSLVAGELGVAYALREFVTFDVGVRGLWQRQEAPEAVFLQGTAFAGVTFRAPPVRL